MIKKAFLQMERLFDDAPEALDVFLRHDKEKLAAYHFTLGLWIRNNILRLDRQLCNLLREMGCSCEDDMSSYLIKAFHEYRNNK